jgi:peptidoglycan/LPS O-acetylase OafA/YrhL
MKARIPSLTGLRFWAAALVAVSHLAAPYFSVDADWAAWLGMSLFFVLSGFVIHYNYGESLEIMHPRAVWLFLSARIARLYPLYILAMIVELALYDLPTIGTFHLLDTAPFFLTLTQNWFPLFIDGKVLSLLHSGPSWSVSTEFALYIFYFVLILPVSRLRSRRAALIAIVVLIVLATVGDIARSILLTADPANWYGYLSPLCRAPEFLLGALVAAAVTEGPPIGARDRRFSHALSLLAVGAILAIGGLCLGAALMPDSLLRRCLFSWGFAPFVALLIYYFAQPSARGSAIVEAPLILMLGEASYSLYLLQPFYLVMFARGLSDDPPFTMFKLAVSLVMMSIISLGSYRYFEAPARRTVRWVLTAHLVKIDPAPVRQSAD